MVFDGAAVGAAAAGAFVGCAAAGAAVGCAALGLPHPARSRAPSSRMDASLRPTRDVESPPLIKASCDVFGWPKGMGTETPIRRDLDTVESDEAHGASARRAEES